MFKQLFLSCALSSISLAVLAMPESVSSFPSMEQPAFNQAIEDTKKMFENMNREEFESFLNTMPNNSHLTNLVSQLSHINTQINAAKKAWKKERIRIVRLKHIAPKPYAKIKEKFDNIINSDAFIANMNTIVDQQFESIVNNHAFFKDVKTENNISDISGKPTPLFNQQLYAAMANKAYYALLGKKLSQKSKELAATIIATQQVRPEMPSLQQAPEWVF